MVVSVVSFILYATLIVVLCVLICRFFCAFLYKHSKVEGCPASEQFSGAEGTTFLQDVQQRAFHVLDQVFGVCKINDALFQRSGAHKRHLRYNLSDIARIDAALADDIRRDALKYGFDVS